MSAIRVMSCSGRPAHPIPITDDTFNDLSHLCFIPIFTNIIDPYMEDSNRSVNTPPPTLLQCITTPAEMAHASTQTEGIEKDTDHPGGQWMHFNPGNTSHYPLVFIGTDTRPHAAKYICYLLVNDGVIHQGTEGKDKAIYGTPLHAHSYPTPNFHRPGVKDTDHTIFHPSSTSQLVVDNALYYLGDPRVIADVHMLHAQYNKLENIKCQCLDLDSQEKQYLTYTTVCTCLQTHLLHTCPLSPPSSFLPCIHAAQEPPEDQWSDVEGKDSLELCAIPKGKCKRTPFPYCLKCSDEEPDHAKGDCPLWKYCRWCFCADHSHDDCPTPHFQCIKDTCVIPKWHSMVGNACPVAFEDNSYKLRCAAWDYDNEERSN